MLLSIYTVVENVHISTMLNTSNNGIHRQQCVRKDWGASLLLYKLDNQKHVY